MVDQPDTCAECALDETGIDPVEALALGLCPMHHERLRRELIEREAPCQHCGRNSRENNHWLDDHPYEPIRTAADLSVYVAAKRADLLAALDRTIMDLRSIHASCTDFDSIIQANIMGLCRVSITRAQATLDRREEM